MAIKVNLLPPEYSVSGSLAKALKTLRNLNVIFLGAFIVFVMAVGGFLIFSTIQVNSLTEKEELLKSQITAQQQSEQQLVLLKDRISKVVALKSVASAQSNFEKIDPFVSGITGESVLTELDIDSKKTDLSVLFRSNSELTNFINALRNSQIFKTVVMSSFGFNPTSGYLVSIHII